MLTVFFCKVSMDAGYVLAEDMQYSHLNIAGIVYNSQCLLKMLQDW